MQFSNLGNYSFRLVLPNSTISSLFFIHTSFPSHTKVFIVLKQIINNIHDKQIINHQQSPTEFLVAFLPTFLDDSLAPLLPPISLNGEFSTWRRFCNAQYLSWKTSARFVGLSEQLHLSMDVGKLEGSCCDALGITLS